MSECRRRLWELMRCAGLHHVLYVDTDCLIVDPVGRRRLDLATGAGGRWPMHVKGTYDRVELLAPRMIVCDGERRFAGVPLQARLDENGRLAGEIFVSLKESMLRHDVSAVEVLKRTFRPEAHDRRRLHLPHGRTTSIVLPTASSACARNHVHTEA
jgi:hypothetical protein